MKADYMDYMEALAILLQVLRLVIAACAVVFSFLLFRHYRRIAWLLLGALFAEPLLESLLRLLRGGSLLSHRVVSLGEGDIQTMTYRIEFPVLYYLAFIGLLMMFREARRRSTA